MLEPRTEVKAFVTPFDGYLQYQAKGGQLDLRTWLNTAPILSPNHKDNESLIGPLYSDLRCVATSVDISCPPRDVNEYSYYIYHGGQLNQEIFEQMYALFNTYGIYHYAPISLDALQLMDNLKAHEVLPPEGIRFLYYQLDNLEKSQLAIGEQGNLNISLSDLPPPYKVRETAVMAASFTGDTGYLGLNRDLYKKLQVSMGKPPWSFPGDKLMDEIRILTGLKANKTISPHNREVFGRDDAPIEFQ